jgi:hypothetical protein
MERRASDYLLRFDVRGPDHLGPFFGVVGQKLFKISRRTWREHQSAKIDETRFDGGVDNCQIDFLVKPINDRSRRIFRRASESVRAFADETGIGLSVASDGSFEVTTRAPAWTFAGNVGSPLSDLGDLSIPASELRRADVCCP